VEKSKDGNQKKPKNQVPDKGKPQKERRTGEKEHSWKRKGELST